jgi:Tfp pilus assembly protein PilO
MAKMRARSKPRKRKAGKVPVARRVVLLSLLFAVAAVAVGVFFTSPQLTAVREARSELATAQERIEDLEARIQVAAGQGDAQLEQLYAAVQVLEEAVPSAPARELLTVQVVQLAEASGVQVQRMDPTDAQVSADSGRHRFNARFAGTYESLLTFLDRLEQQGPLVTLSSVQLSAQGDLYLLSMTMTFWYVQSERLTEPLAPVAVPTLPDEDLFAPELDFGPDAEGLTPDDAIADETATDGAAAAASGSGSGPLPVVAFAGCAELNAVYPGGVALTGVTGDMVSGQLLAFGIAPVFDDALYAANRGRDGDGDGIACEQR